MILDHMIHLLGAISSGALDALKLQCAQCDTAVPFRENAL